MLETESSSGTHLFGVTQGIGLVRKSHRAESSANPGLLSSNPIFAMSSLAGLRQTTISQPPIGNMWVIILTHLPYTIGLL